MAASQLAPVLWLRKIAPGMWRCVFQKLVLGLCLAWGGTAHAHQVPNMTIEAVFAASGQATLRINLDPRVFLSEQPTELSAVPAAWFQEQSVEQWQATQRKAWKYLNSCLVLHVGDGVVPLPEGGIVPLNGADNTPMTPDTAEVHLLATAQFQVPDDAETYHLDFSRTANVSLILLNNLDGQPESHPQVVFPGESSRPFAIRSKNPETSLPPLQKLEIAPVQTPASAVPQEKDGRKWLPWIPVISAIGSFIMLIMWRLRVGQATRRSD